MRKAQFSVLSLTIYLKDIISSKKDLASFIFSVQEITVT